MALPFLIKYLPSGSTSSSLSLSKRPQYFRNFAFRDYVPSSTNGTIRIENDLIRPQIQKFTLHQRPLRCKRLESVSEKRKAERLIKNGDYGLGPLFASVLTHGLVRGLRDFGSDLFGLGGMVLISALRTSFTESGVWKTSDTSGSSTTTTLPSSGWPAKRFGLAFR